MAVKSARELELEAQIAALQATNKANLELTFKVAEKSAGLSVYGLQQYPVTLFRDQWERLFANIDGIKAFLTANPAVITKGESIKRKNSN